MDISSAKLSKIIVHKVGNKLRDEGLRLSTVECPRSRTLDDLLLRGLLAPVTRNGHEYYLAHESDISLNTINHYAEKIFSNSDEFQESSEAIAKHLYACSSHPNIGGGEFFVLLFDDIRVDGVPQQALGLFRVESRDDYLDVGEEKGLIQVVERSGISLDKVQKGAVVMSNDLKVFVIDSLGQKTKYWIEDFLKVVRSQTPQRCAQIAGALLNAVSGKVDTPNDAIEFARQVEDLIAETGSPSLADLKSISRRYIDEDSLGEILNGAHLKYGVALDDNVLIESKRLTKYAKDVVTKARIAEGVSLLVTNPDAKISSIDVKSTEDGVCVVVNIALKGV